MKLFSNKVVQYALGLGLALAFVVGVAVPHSASAAMLTRQLEFGMTGSDVSDLQTFLAADPSIYPQGLVTGYFGSLTKAAVMNFQARNGISTVGRVGPQTMAVINSKMGSADLVGTDRQAPVIGPVSVNVSSSTATFSWNTNENTSALVYFSTSPIIFSEGSGSGATTISGTSAIANLNLSTTHAVTLTGLQSNTRYYYVVYVKDASGNESVTWPVLFQTSQ